MADLREDEETAFQKNYTTPSATSSPAPVHSASKTKGLRAASQGTLSTSLLDRPKSALQKSKRSGCASHPTMFLCGNYIIVFLLHNEAMKEKSKETHEKFGDILFQKGAAGTSCCTWYFLLYTGVVGNWRDLFSKAQNEEMD
ncbi:hypothetical protein QYF61_016952 [Mycteria americana]|uniref:Uncharacterized protein n=1 Tax=Mycteria americana TaxID=33587 RepID=A0AAN7PKA2_MYCAM|nr:hypothetical protein QYF61_016952 [Mycteria americana]